MKTDGSENRELMRGEYRPIGWSADSRTLYVTGFRPGSGPPQLLAVAVAGRSPRTVLALPAGFAVEDITRDGTLVVANQREWRADAWQIAIGSVAR